jgi:hypothetical protein
MSVSIDDLRKFALKKYRDQLAAIDLFEIMVREQTEQEEKDKARLRSLVKQAEKILGE